MKFYIFIFSFKIHHSSIKIKLALDYKDYEPINAYFPWGLNTNPPIQRCVTYRVELLKPSWGQATGGWFSGLLYCRIRPENWKL